ncbi:MAG: methyltransferase domain-containing protein [Clostridia bacterium]|nr:methyltransferase domain-containing protein [Clostridia bacterium]
MAYLKKALLQAHELAEKIVRPGDAVIDATMGNGHDTLFMADLVGEAGRVYAFDIQESAVAKTRERIEKAGFTSRCHLIHDGHQNMDLYVKEPVKLIIYNLGYLPGGDHNIGTRAETTIAAVEKSLSLISNDGLVIIVIYHGGDSGFEERDALLSYLISLDCKKYSVMKTDFINQINCPPILIAIEKNLKD